MDKLCDKCAQHADDHANWCPEFRHFTFGVMSLTRWLETVFPNLDDITFH